MSTETSFDEEQVVFPLEQPHRDVIHMPHSLVHLGECFVSHRRENTWWEYSVSERNTDSIENIE